MLIFMGIGLTAFLAFVFGGGKHFLYRWMVVTLGVVAFGCLFLFVMLGELMLGIPAAKEVLLTFGVTVAAAIGLVSLMNARGGNIGRLWTPGG